MAAFDWNRFLDLADDLARSGEAGEAAERTAISRAYYAAYHAASAYARSRTLVPATQRMSHDLLWRTLANDADPARLDAGERGYRLRDLRMEADYRPEFSDGLTPEVRVADAIMQARDLIALIGRLP